MRGKSVLELGSSHGLASMVASAMGAARTVATDQPHVVPYLRDNISANAGKIPPVEVCDRGELLLVRVAL